MGSEQTKTTGFLDGDIVAMLARYDQLRTDLKAACADAASDPDQLMGLVSEFQVISNALMEHFKDDVFAIAKTYLAVRQGFSEFILEAQLPVEFIEPARKPRFYDRFRGRWGR